MSLYYEYAGDPYKAFNGIIGKIDESKVYGLVITFTRAANRNKWLSMKNDIDNFASFVYWQFYGRLADMLINAFKITLPSWLPKTGLDI